MRTRPGDRRGLEPPGNGKHNSSDQQGKGYGTGACRTGPSTRQVGVQTVATLLKLNAF